MLFFTKVEFILYLFQELLEIKKFIFRTLERVRGGVKGSIPPRIMCYAIIGRSDDAFKRGGVLSVILLNQDIL